jgi:transcription antitermination factor NusG
MAANFDNREKEEINEVRWFVAHTRPRCEKKLVLFCDQKNINHVLPCYKSLRRYRSKKKIFYKPLFPGYVFLKMLPTLQRQVLSSDYVANLLKVTDQELFQKQLNDILLALDTNYEIHLAPQIVPGVRVLIKSGPLYGLTGEVIERNGSTFVLLRLDFIGKAAAVRIPADQLELI